MSDTPWMDIAKSEIGTSEMSGFSSNPRIVEYAQETALAAQSDETAWCSSFANWVFKQVGIKGTHNASARSWLTWGIELKEPKYGCLVIFWRDSPDSSRGHVAFFVSEDQRSVEVLGGNQNNSVCIMPYPKERIISYRWPSP